MLDNFKVQNGSRIQSIIIVIVERFIPSLVVIIPVCIMVFTPTHNTSYCNSLHT